MSRKRTWNEEDLIAAVKEKFSIRQVLLAIGLRETGENYATFHRMVKKLNLDTSHFTGMGHLKGKHNPWCVSIPLEKILVENSEYSNTHTLKKRLIKAGILANVCYVCQSKPEWLGKPLSLQLDHINGVRTDHRIENLRILCPNCHAQTDTFSGKHNKRVVR